MKFNTAIIKYDGNDSWVENALFKAKETLVNNTCPKHSSDCEYYKFLKGINY